MWVPEGVAAWGGCAPSALGVRMMLCRYLIACEYACDETRRGAWRARRGGGGAAQAWRARRAMRRKRDGTSLSSRFTKMLSFNVRTVGAETNVEKEEVYTRSLPLTSCQEDRLGLDYTVLCHG